MVTIVLGSDGFHKAVLQCSGKKFNIIDGDRVKSDYWLDSVKPDTESVIIDECAMTIELAEKIKALLTESALRICTKHDPTIVINPQEIDFIFVIRDISLDDLKSIFDRRFKEIQVIDTKSPRKLALKDVLIWALTILIIAMNIYFYLTH